MQGLKAEEIANKERAQIYPASRYLEVKDSFERDIVAGTILLVVIILSCISQHSLLSSIALKEGQEEVIFHEEETVSQLAQEEVTFNEEDEGIEE